jgi:hypothetical protein
VLGALEPKKGLKLWRPDARVGGVVERVPKTAPPKGAVFCHRYRDLWDYLLYDEYVAYDVSQLRLRYLFGVQM